jgi:ABC-type multidrug transport system fused ATPase/permease subunit
VLGATVFNIFVMILIMTIGLAALSMLAGENISQTAAQILFLLLFFGSVGGSFLIYHWVVRLLSRKFDLDRYFHPIFRKKT